VAAVSSVDDLLINLAPLGADLHSSNKPGEISQWLCHDDITINIGICIIIKPPLATARAA